MNRVRSKDPKKRRKEPRNKIAVRLLNALTERTYRTQITNGKKLLPGVDNRSLWVRRLKDLIAIYTLELGGIDAISQFDFDMVRRCATMNVLCEMMDVKLAKDGSLPGEDIDLYQRLTNSLTRTFKELRSTHAPFKQSARTRANGDARASAYASDIAIIDAELA
ncbi:MAG: hypothetical protein AB7S41_01360 [Parvibaculaceae bacterium]